MNQPPHKAEERSGKTTQKSGTKQENEPRLPHEHDESADSQQDKGQPLIKQAYKDVESGLEDTDLRGSRGKREPAVPKGKK